MASPNWVQEKTQLSPATVHACLRELEKLGIVNEITGQNLVHHSRAGDAF
jgi:Fe2+ or Zn2+ uptake regulation protein